MLAEKESQKLRDKTTQREANKAGSCAMAAPLIDEGRERAHARPGRQTGGQAGCVWPSARRHGAGVVLQRRAGRVAKRAFFFFGERRRVRRRAGQQQATKNDAASFEQSPGRRCRANTTGCATRTGRARRGAARYLRAMYSLGSARWHKAHPTWRGCLRFCLVVRGRAGGGRETRSGRTGGPSLGTR